jgi:UDP-N-acetylglucosamine 1-carboxyvinyltransferase
MNWLEVKSSGPLKGTIQIPGSKNSSLAVIAASCLSDKPVTLKNVPNNLDTNLALGIITKLGGIVERTNDIIIIDPREIKHAELDIENTSAYRASYYFIGALLAKFKKVKIGYPGGDDFGSRPIEQHIKGFKAMDAKISLKKEHYEIDTKLLNGADIYFDMKTSGATMNLMIAATRAKGSSILRNAATDPEVVDLANFLNRMGANIKGAGTQTIRITGVNTLCSCEYSIIPDRLIAGSFMMAVGITQGELKLIDVIPEHLDSCIAKLSTMGLVIEEMEKGLSVSFDGSLPLTSTNIRAEMYPGFATDLQQPIAPLLLSANGKSVVTDNVYPFRFNHIKELNKMGAGIQVSNNGALIQGRKQLRGTWVEATDIRAGTSLILAGLSAEGITSIKGVEHIQRGYPDVIHLFNSLGAELKYRSTESAVDTKG